MNMEIKKFEDKYSGYLSDESRAVGYAEFIAFPESESDLAECLNFAEKNRLKTTVRGAGTGLLGRAVPCGGLLISTEKMNKIYGVEKFGDGYVLSAECGATLQQVEDYLKTSFPDYVFAPNPTEKGATVGGLFACDAVGLNLLQEGRFSAHIAEFVCLYRDTIRLNEADFTEKKEALSFSQAAKTNLIERVKKNAAVVASLKLKLSKRRGVFWGVVYFFASEHDAENFISELLAWRNGSAFGREALAALTYFNGKVLELIANGRERPEFSALPEIPKISYEKASGGNTEQIEMFSEVKKVTDEKASGADAEKVEVFSESRKITDEKGNGWDAEQVEIFSEIKKVTDEKGSGGDAEKVEVFSEVKKVTDEKVSGVDAEEAEVFSEVLKTADEKGSGANEDRGGQTFGNTGSARLAGAAIYVELSGGDREKIEEALLFHAEIFERFGEENWAACGESELQKFRDMCHAAADAINVFEDSKREEYAFGYVAEDGKIIKPGR
jgi:D-lactate dehydrogenase (cytochrome)